jgi:hypothetical protein
VPLTVGDALQIQEVAVKKGWYRGINLTTQQQGIFPISYVLVKKPEDSNNVDIVNNELASVIREWGSILKTYYKVPYSFLFSFSLLYASAFIYIVTYALGVVTYVPL